MKALIKGLHTSVGSIGNGGWDGMDKSAWGKVGSEIKKQYRYLHGFAESIEENKDKISIEAIISRSHMYGEASGYTAEILGAGKIADYLPWIPKDGTTDCLVNCKCYWELLVVSKTKTVQTVQATWNLSPAEHCATCLGRDKYIAVIHVPIAIRVPKIIGGM
jgi:hypothetical protein